MENPLIGRLLEQEILAEALHSNEAELVSIIGRRRVGKTFLVESFYENQLVFQISGIQNIKKQGQLRNFSAQLSKSLKKNATFPMAIKEPTEWFDAFLMLIDYLETIGSEEKKVVFFDELPWLATRKSGFISAFSYFWNSWAARQKNLVVVICGSAASWMINKIVKDKGGLHNRITKRIYIKPFTLGETTLYLNSRNIRYEQYEILHLYMAMGGIPHYLKEVKKGKSIVQNIDSICFSDTGLLRDEFSNLYTALFENAEKHVAVIRALATKRKGMTREEIIKATKVTNNGGVTNTLEELEQSGFIAAYYPFGKKKKGRLFRLTDEYSLFYIQFIEDKRNEGAGIWHHLSQTPAYTSWSGYAFESICIKHIQQIKKALDIAGIYALSSTFYKKGTKEEKGIQVDLILDRNDNVINLFEIKFSKEPYTLSKAYQTQLREKQGIFRQISKTRKRLSWIMITTFGLKTQTDTTGIIETDLKMDVLFREV